MGNTDELFSQILWSCSQIILFIQQINWLLLPTVQQCIVGLNCPIIDCRHTTSLSLGFAILMKNSQIYFFRLLSNTLFLQLSLPSSLIIVSLNIEGTIHSGNCIDWLWRYKTLPPIDVSEDALHCSWNIDLHIYSMCQYRLMVKEMVGGNLKKVII